MPLQSLPPSCVILLSVGCRLTKILGSRQKVNLDKRMYSAGSTLNTQKGPGAAARYSDGGEFGRSAFRENTSNVIVK